MKIKPNEGRIIVKYTKNEVTQGGFIDVSKAGKDSSWFEIIDKGEGIAAGYGLMKKAYIPRNAVIELDIDGEKCGIVHWLDVAAWQ